MVLLVARKALAAGGARRLPCSHAVVRPLSVAVSPSTRADGTLTDEAVSASARAVNEHGVCMIEGLLEDQWLDESHQICNSLFDECMGKVPPMAVGKEAGYAEVVQRATGRYDMLYRMEEHDHFHRAKALWEPIISEALQEDYHQLFTGLLMTLPGAGEQLWHADGAHTKIRRY